MKDKFIQEIDKKISEILKSNIKNKLKIVYTLRFIKERRLKDLNLIKSD